MPTTARLAPMPTSPTINSLRRPILSMKAIAISVASTFTPPITQSVTRARCLGREAGRRENLVGVVDDRVDAGDLLEHRQPDRDHQRPPPLRMEKLAPASGIGVLRERGLDGVEPGLDVRVGLDAAQLGGGIGTAVFEHQPARRFRREQADDEQRQPRHRRRVEHQAPVGFGGEQAVDEVGQEDADRDRHLVAGNEAPTQWCRGQFGGVERRGNCGHTHASADHEPGDHQNRRVGGEVLHRGAECEQRAGDRHGALSAEAVSELTARERLEQRAERDPARHHLNHQQTQRERGLDARQRA